MQENSDILLISALRSRTSTTMGTFYMLTFVCCPILGTEHHYQHVILYRPDCIIR